MKLRYYLHYKIKSVGPTSHIEGPKFSKEDLITKKSRQVHAKLSKV